MSSQLEGRIRQMMQRVVDESPPPPEIPVALRLAPGARRRFPNWAIAVAAAAGVVVLIGAAAWLVGAEDTGFSDRPVPTTTSGVTTTTLTTTTSAASEVTVPPAGAWNPILATTRAETPPPAATCPPGTEPDAPGPVPQERPAPGWVGNLAGVFDQRSGRIIYVDESFETWGFDVCTDTWLKMNAVGTLDSHPMAGYVYDVDSDLTVGLSLDEVAVYDAQANRWTRQDNPITRSEGDDGLLGPLGAVYDPVSGLIVTSTSVADRWELWAYDVDTNEATRIGLVPVERTTPCCTQIDLLGYAPASDSLILATYVADEEVTLLVDPRTGATTYLATETPIVDLGWPGRVYGPGGGTVYVSDYVLGSGWALCGFNPGTMVWGCHASPPDVPGHYFAFAAVVGDVINNRLVLINGVYGDWWRSAADDIWAIDLDTGEWTQLLEPSSQ